MAQPFRSYSSYFRDLQGESEPRPETGGGLTYDPETGIAPPPEQPETPPIPPTPTFTPFGEEEPAVAPSADLGPTRALSAAFGGWRRQRPSRSIPRPVVDQQPQTRSVYTSNFEYDMSGDTRPPPAPAQAVAPEPAPIAAPVAPPPPPAIAPPAEIPSLIGYEAPQATQDYYSQLVAPLTEQLGEGFGTLGGAQEEFYGQLPDIQTWQTLGGPALMQTALGASGPERLAAEQQLKEILGTQYAGPAGLALEVVNELYGLQASVQPYGAGELGTMAGAGSLLEEFTPGLTPGMRREEARRLLQSEDYRDLTRQLGRDVSRLGGTTEREIGSAMEAATGQREAGAALRGEATGALSGAREEISTEVGGRLEEARAERQAREAAYEEYSRTGDIGALADYGITPETFQSELGDLDVEAKAAKAAVMGDARFQEIADVPLMQLGVSSHGRQKLDFPQEWYDKNKGRYTKGEMAGLKKLARQRQTALDEAGFARAGWKGNVGGKYAGVESIYFGGDAFTPGDPSTYISAQQADPATRHNLATQAQREDFNWINEMLGEVDRLQEVDPYQAGEIVADTEAYLDDLETQYEEAFGDIKETAAEFDKMRRRIRKDYRKAKRRSKYASIGAGVGTVVGLPTVGATVGAGLA